MEFVISINSRSGKSWNLRESHGKSWKNIHAWQKDILKIEIITDESETCFNFSENRHKRTLYALQYCKIH